MNLAKVRKTLGQAMAGAVNFYERRPGIHQLIVPIFHEDGDMVDVYASDSPRGEQYVRICDFGMALMRLSYTFDVTTPTHERILSDILANNGVQESDGNLYLDAPIDMIYESVLQFTGCVLKVCSMDYWGRETVRDAFYDDLADFISSEMKRFSPMRDHAPLEDDLYSVDWLLRHGGRNLYVFGVRGDDKARNVTISLREFQKARLQFVSLVVHEDMEELGRQSVRYLTKNADKQYQTLEDFQETAVRDVERVAT